MFRITPDVALADDEIRERFVPAAGSQDCKDARRAIGVELRLDIVRSSLPEDVKFRLLARGGRGTTADGVLVVVSRARRSRQLNREAARDRLVSLIRAAMRPAPPRLPTARPRVTRPSRTTGRAHTGLYRAVAGKIF